jgi:glycosyltransferase involved in cell wall biosynthesis
MTATRPLVSVYLPTRNRPRLLREAVESVLGQTFGDFELLIVDDGSDDALNADGGTQAAIDEFIARDSRVKMFRHETPLGAPAARNRAIAEAQGRYLTGLDDDDLMLPNRLQTLLAANLDSYSLVCSSFFLEKNGVRRLFNNRKRLITLDEILHFNMVDNQALFLTKRAQALSGFDEALLASQDYDFWTRLIENFGPCLRIATPSYVRREGIDSNAITWSSRFAIGSRQYTQKHWSKMSADQKKSQALINRITAQEPIGLRETLEYARLPTRQLAARYWLSKMLK